MGIRTYHRSRIGLYEIGMCEIDVKCKIGVKCEIGVKCKIGVN